MANDDRTTQRFRRPATRARSERGDNHVEIRFEDGAWRVTGADLADELVFEELADAERCGIELSRDLHVGVIVYGDSGSVLARYSSRMRPGSGPKPA